MSIQQDKNNRQNREQLKTYFETGDRPTEVEFAEAIDSWINQLDDDLHAVDSKIGIGTDNPQEKLHVKGNIEVSGSIVGDKSNTGSNDNLQLYNNASVQLFGLDHPTRKGDVYINGDAENGSGKITFNQRLSTGNWRNNMIVAPDGNVGIGEANPTDKLEVGGNVGVQGHIYGKKTGKPDAQDVMVVGNNSVIQFHGDRHPVKPGGMVVGVRIDDQKPRSGKTIFAQNNVNGGWKENMVIDFFGHVGVGTSFPGNQLHLVNTNPKLNPGTGLRLQTGAADGKILVSNATGDAEWQDKTVVTSGLWKEIGNGNIENGNSANVGIGTGNPRGRLEVNGTIVAGNGNIAGGSSLFLDASIVPGETGANIGLYNANASNNSGGIDFNSFGSGVGSAFNFIRRGPSGSPSNVSMRLDGFGRVGIATSEPKEQFQIGTHFTYHNGGNKYLGYNSYYKNGNNNRLQDDHVGILSLAGGSFRFQTAPYGTENSVITPSTVKEPLSVLNNGRVGISNTNPQYPLDVGAVANFNTGFRVNNAMPFVIKKYKMKRDTYEVTITDYSPNDYVAFIGNVKMGPITTLFGVLPVDEYFAANIFVRNTSAGSRFVIEARFPNGVAFGENGGKGKKKEFQVIFIKKEIVRVDPDAAEV